MTVVLGCGAYEAYIYLRGGSDFITDLPWDSISWGRAVDDTSSSTVSCTIAAEAECRPDLADVRPWRHELGLFRDGVLVWAGPILAVRGGNERYQIDARDLTAWWDHRLIHHDVQFQDTELAVIFKAISDDAMDPDPSPGLIVNPTITNVKTSLSILATQHQFAGVILRDLSKTGIDWTAKAREILVGGTVVPADPIGTFTDEHFVHPPTPILDGSQQANRVIVAGAGSGASGATVYAEAVRAVSEDADGLLESVSNISSIQDYKAALAAAESRAELAQDVVAVQDASLDPSAPFDIEALIPGALCRLELTETVVPVSGLFRLQSMNVSVNASDNDELVTLAFQPPGTADAA